MNFLIVFVSPLSLAFAGPQITPITTGAVIAHKEPVREIREYVKVFVALTYDHSLDSKWNALLNQLDNLTKIRFPTNVNTVYQMQQIMLRRIDVLRHRVAKPKRSKRGLFNFIGDIGSALFGIPSQSDITSLKRANEKLASAVEGVVRNQRRIIAKVNL